MRLLCPHCGSHSHVTRTKQITQLTRELYHQCNNPKCGHAFVSLQEITGMEGETITMQEIFRFRATGRGAEGKVLGQFEATGIRPKFLAETAAYGITLEPELFRPDIKLG